MEQIAMLFNITEDTMVVTSMDITQDGLPILQVSHEDDEEGGSLWQFHSGSGNYSMDRIQLVRLSTVMSIDPDIGEIAGLAMGRTARRRAKGEPWLIS
jgi:hypothetical protein